MTQVDDLGKKMFFSFCSIPSFIRFKDQILKIVCILNITIKRGGGASTLNHLPILGIIISSILQNLRGLFFIGIHFAIKITVFYCFLFGIRVVIVRAH